MQELSYAFVNSWAGNFKVIDFSNIKQPKIVAELKNTGNVYKNIYLDRNYIYAAALGDGLQIISVKDPLNPEIVDAVYETGFTNSVYVNRPYIYVTGDYFNNNLLNEENSKLSIIKIN